jgi:uncharacterized protein (TIGR03437 family)
MQIHKSQYRIPVTFGLYALLLLLACAPAAFGQSFDASGNGTLRGAYFVRELLLAGQNGPSVSKAVSVVGTMTFNGNGGYSFSGQQTTRGGATNAALSLSGTYQAAPNGFVIIQSLADPSDSEYGGISGPVGPNAFTASATEKGNSSIMVGIPEGSNLSNSSLSGSWSAASLEVPNADLSLSRNAKFTFNADGAGNFGSITASGMAVNLGNTGTSQTVTGASYSLSGSGGTANFGASSQSQLISGTKNISISADSNIILGGAPDGFDFFLAVRSLNGTASNSSANGIYYISGFGVASGGILPYVLTAYNGSMNSTGSGVGISHNRSQSSLGAAFDNTSSSTFNVAGDGTFKLSNSLAQYTVGDSGQAFIATGSQGVYWIAAGFHAQPFSGSGVYLNPLGVVNSGSFAPATNPVAPGEIISIFGTGMSNSNVSAQTLPLPTDLGGVSVTVNGTKIPLFYVSPTQITAMAPYGIAPASGVNYATFKVINNGTTSNSTTMYVRGTAPGIFSLSENGIGPAAAQHGNYSVVSSSNPAHSGETVAIYVGGLGAVSPAVTEGNGAPGNSLSSATGKVSVVINGSTLTPSFSGLTPGAAGLYQVNVTIPSVFNASDALIDVLTAEGSSSEATISVAP